MEKTIILFFRKDLVVVGVLDTYALLHLTHQLHK
jgi:hypothetical protein